MSRARLVIGCMSGTSCDGVDAAVVLADGDADARKTSIIASGSVPLGEDGRRLRAISLGAETTAAEICSLVGALTERHADAISIALDRAERALPQERVAVIACHGQTLHHAGGLSWQVFNPAPIARRFGVPVVHDLRAAGLAGGGEGAPITPTADAVLYAAHRPISIVNLGGFCNITHLGARGTVSGRDVCSCNHLLDAAASELLGLAFDDGGRAALRGAVDAGRAAAVAERLAHTPAAPRSLGSGDEHQEFLECLGGLSPGDALATLADAIGRTIASDLGDATQAALAGGGARNAALVDAIIRHAPHCRIRLSDAFGVPIQAREAAAMGVLGLLSLEGIPITLPGVTGVGSPPPVSGSWTLPPDGSWEVMSRPSSPRTVWTASE